MPERNRRMIISSRWAQVAVLTFLVGFATLGYLAYSLYQEHPPIPERVVAPDGRVVFTGEDVMAGQHIFQKFGLMQLGSIFGHGAYLGPDFTAQYLQFAGRSMLDFISARAAASRRPGPSCRRSSSGTLTIRRRAY